MNVKVNLRKCSTLKEAKRHMMTKGDHDSKLDAFATRHLMKHAWIPWMRQCGHSLHSSCYFSVSIKIFQIF